MFIHTSMTEQRQWGKTATHMSLIKSTKQDAFMKHCTPTVGGVTEKVKVKSWSTLTNCHLDQRNMHTKYFTCTDQKLQARVKLSDRCAHKCTDGWTDLKQYTTQSSDSGPEK